MKRAKGTFPATDAWVLITCFVNIIGTLAIWVPLKEHIAGAEYFVIATFLLQVLFAAGKPRASDKAVAVEQYLLRNSFFSWMPTWLLTVMYAVAASNMFVLLAAILVLLIVAVRLYSSEGRAQRSWQLRKMFGDVKGEAVLFARAPTDMWVWRNEFPEPGWVPKLSPLLKIVPFGAAVLVVVSSRWEANILEFTFAFYVIFEGCIKISLPHYDFYRGLLWAERNNDIRYEAIIAPARTLEALER